MPSSLARNTEGSAPQASCWDALRMSVRGTTQASSGAGPDLCDSVSWSNPGRVYSGQALSSVGAGGDLRTAGRHGRARTIPGSLLCALRRLLSSRSPQAVRFLSRKRPSC
ncbi:hypothetical protein DGo_CA1564 [Deinococcus gobiensis I-0]|uniref:Uncharacterized protein n=1 Tax=Deinococcus gobiensis (strain DSM 21396 / JCM 16679 / CGMCC 1.7299 / I-0) TaxID=745776 RepID=H8GUX4_DEIGI|nr:hypothetical protein DGo_CA1564 [Deinococcus gobiensis I-0]